MRVNEFLSQWFKIISVFDAFINGGLFKKRRVSTKCDIYVLITPYSSEISF